MLFTVGAWWARGAAAAGPLGLLVEAVAQSAALVLHPGAAEPSRLALAAIDRARLDVAPQPGQSGEIEVAIEARYGGLIRVRGFVRVDGRAVGEATVVLATG